MTSSDTFMDDQWIIHISVALWEIWKERCNCVFEDAKPNPFNTIKKIQVIYHQLSHCRNSSYDKSDNHPTKNANWKPPPNSFVSLCCDESFKFKFKESDIGLIIRNYAGVHQSSRCIYKNEHIDSKEFECDAVLDAVRWATILGIQNLKVETDSKNVAAAVNGAITCLSWQNQRIVEDIKIYLNNFNSWICQHISRDYNKPTDSQAMPENSKFLNYGTLLAQILYLNNLLMR
ncbi:uncharacterized protein LOC113336812 [Papaver somniferum]|uniref:uncharacterized protein LOC113336812 n=1 Tax=Papaver somniferum TaxID=3469 RepID=UPI000E6FD16F|nr:uncharacterized protein LOC113336812 [Papaver somniferum]